MTARRAGMGVDGIVFWLLGGASRLEGRPRSPGTEFLVAAAGPAASATIAAGFLTVTPIVSGLGGGALLTATLWWLGTMNALIAVFNLLPAAPLDGGRVLRALLWRLHGDHDRAAATASRSGVILGAAMIAGGIVDAALRIDLAGLWLVPMGAFICRAARAERPVPSPERRDLALPV
jgi:Zn-dependent protease